MAKAKINPPTKLPTDPLYHTECLQALEPSLSGLAALAIKAGWPQNVAAYALMVLSARMIETGPTDDQTET